MRLVFLGDFGSLVFGVKKTDGVFVNSAKRVAAPFADLLSLSLVVMALGTQPSELLDLMVFDTAVNPAGGGATLTCGYRRVSKQRGAVFRALNTEYVPGQAGDHAALRQSGSAGRFLPG